MLNRLGFIFSVIGLFIYSMPCNAQSLNQKDLELKRISLAKEINNIQKLINRSKDERKLVVENLDKFNDK